MNDNCFDPGIIQAFLDGETSPDVSFKLTDHTAKCDECALALAQAEEENSLVFAMLDREMNTLVPTQRLWSSISVALAEEKRRHSIWDKVRLGILAAFASPSISVAAGVLVVFGLFASVWLLKTPDVEVAGTLPVQQQPVQQSAPATHLASAGTTADTQTFPAPDFGVQETRLPAAKIRDMVRPAVDRSAGVPVRAERAVLRPEAEVFLPGEESYIRTIANLKETVEGRKDSVMSPSVRVSYERDMAVVNDSIKRMKDVVRKNPKNQAARQVLYSSYQNKIELLNSIVDREELMASMQ